MDLSKQVRQTSVRNGLDPAGPALRYSNDLKVSSISSFSRFVGCRRYVWICAGFGDIVCKYKLDLKL